MKYCRKRFALIGIQEMRNACDNAEKYLMKRDIKTSRNEQTFRALNTRMAKANIFFADFCAHQYCRGHY